MNISSIQLLYSKLNARVIILQDLSPSHHPVKLVLLKNRAKTNSNFKSRVFGLCDRSGPQGDKWVRRFLTQKLKQLCLNAGGTAAYLYPSTQLSNARLF